MATVNINPGDDIQSKVNASAAGDTINFAAGVHSPPHPVKFNKPGQTITGTPATTIRSSMREYSFCPAASGLRFTGLGFDGPSFGWFDGAPPVNLKIDGNRLRGSK